MTKDQTQFLDLIEAELKSMMGSVTKALATAKYYPDWLLIRDKRKIRRYRRKGLFKKYAPNL